MMTSTDLDALLVSALYGELSPAERARLEAHLATSPGDRAALDALTEARAIIQKSGWSAAAGMVEPPTAVSAKLVRLAADARPRPGLWARFMDGIAAFGRSPALAAAAMAVVVAGGAGLLYMRSGGSAPERSAAPATATLAAADAPGSTTAAGSAVAAPTATAQAHDGIAFEANLDEGVGMAGGTKAPRGIAIAPRSPTDPELKDVGGGERTATVAKTPEREKAASDRAETTIDADAAVDRGPVDYNAGAAGAPAPTLGAAAPDATADAAAVTLHATLVKLVAAGKCTEAGALGGSLARAHPAYYAREVATDRRLVSCRPYIERAAVARPADVGTATTSTGGR